MARYLFQFIKADLQKKMVLLAGPRQVGKTTLAKSLGKGESDYLNWDVAADKQRILKGQWEQKAPLLILDEVHKYKHWRALLKGIVDSKDRHGKSLLVTGSAKLEYYRRGGDSLQGRYHLFRLHPFSVAELELKTASQIQKLLDRGGFPEPYYESSEKQARRWRLDYRDRLVHEEIQSLEKVNDLSLIELLALRLPELVGSPLSVNALREDLQCSHRGVSRWLQILERLYLIFRISPFGSPRIKAVKKEQKHYHWDWATVEDPGFRFENFIASHLLKWVHYQRDVEGEEFELQYIRDHSKREVDFVIAKKRRPVLMVEAKLSEQEISPSLIYFKTKFPECRAVQVCLSAQRNTVDRNGIESLDAARFLPEFV